MATRSPERRQDAAPGPSSTVNVEIVESGPKRRIVDANDTETEIIDAEKAAVPEKIQTRARVMKFIAHSHRSILIALKLEEHADNLSLGDQIHNILFKAYIVLRRIHNETGHALASKISSTSYTVTFLGREHTIEGEIVYKILVDEAIRREIPFGKYDQSDPKNWYGIVNPLLNYLSGFALRREELRLGHRTITINREYNQKTAVRLADYGVYDRHHMLCEGISFPPGKRSSLAQSLGPITVLICYLTSQKQFSEKWEQVVKRVLGHLPRIDTIFCLRGSDPSEIRTVISLLADAMVLTTTRQKMCMFPPPAAFSFIFTQDEIKYDDSTYSTESILHAFKFSGYGASLFYKLFCQYTWKLNLNEGTEGMAREITYHSIFGSYKEDLSLLAQITDQGSWLTRKQFGKVFQGKNTAGTEVKFSPINQIYYYNFDQPKPTGFATYDCNSQMSSISCFSGRTRRVFSDAFFNYLGGGIRDGRSIESMILAYTLIKEKLRELPVKERHKVIEMGATSWYLVKDITPTLDSYPKAKLEFDTSGIFFFGENV